VKYIILSITSIVLYSNTFVVITSNHSNIASIDKKELQAIYLSKKHTNLIPINLPFNSIQRDSFESSILNISHTKLNSYWIKQHYLGKRPPKVIKSQKGVLLFITKIPNSIGYIDKKSLIKDIKILYEWSDNEK